MFKGVGIPTKHSFLKLVLVLGRTTTNSVFQMVVFLWGLTVLFGFPSSYWIWQQGERVPSTGRGEQSREFQRLVFGRATTRTTPTLPQFVFSQVMDTAAG